MANILVVDDDESVATALQRFLAYEGHNCRLASSAVDGLRAIDQQRPDVVMMDIRMPGVDGLAALEQVRTRHPGLCVVMMTGYGTSQTSIDAMRGGAFDYLTKPPDLDDLRSVIARALATKEVEANSSPPGDAFIADDPRTLVRLVGETAAMRDLYKMIGRIADSDVPVLVTGERGAGKGLVAATLHDNSPLRDRSLVVLDCATPPPALEEELFDSGDGTLHLVDIHAMPAALQMRLVRALQTRSERLPSADLAARVVASTTTNLSEAVAVGTFSRELYDLISLITLHLPPLRERRDDIPLLIRHFVLRLNAQLDRTIKGVDDLVAKRLQEHSWPGNVGELERVLKRAAIVARSEVITTDDLGSMPESPIASGTDTAAALTRAARLALCDRLVEGSDAGPTSPFHDIIDLVEATLVKEALLITNGNQLKAAELLGVNRATLRKKAR